MSLANSIFPYPGRLQIFFALFYRGKNQLMNLSFRYFAQRFHLQTYFSCINTETQRICAHCVLLCVCISLYKYVYMEFQLS